MACRIGVYVILSGVVLDLALHDIWGFDYVVPGVGIYGALLFPFGILLLVGGAFLRLREKWDSTLNRVSLTSPGLPAGKLQLGSAPRINTAQEPYKIHTDSWLLRTTAIAIILCAAGFSLYFGFKHWLETRTLELVNIPVSLSPGHIRTGNFYINLRELYYIDVDVDYQFPEDAKCRLAGPDSVLKTRLILYRDGQILGQSDGDKYSSIGYFYADKKGNYDLDVQVLTDAGCLNVLNPRIRIQTSPDYSGLQSGIGCLAATLILAGISLLAHSIGAWIMGRQSARHNAPTIFQDAHYKIYPSPQPLIKRLAPLPPFGLFCAATLAVAAVLPMLVLKFAFGPIPKGVFVSLLRNDFSVARPGSWSKPIVIRIQDVGPAPPKLYLNSTPVSWESLHDAVKAELARRADWTVYVRGDEGIPFQEVVLVMDIIREEHAKVVLLTPNTEKLVLAQ
jgi:biopolymer transport protein ExbD